MTSKSLQSKFCSPSLWKLFAVAAAAFAVFASWLVVRLLLEIELQIL